jgi:sterol desaturase/sphingolipid hydroxylase (fatty acid hydroxylase superfamily)
MSIFAEQLFLLITTPLFVVTIALEWGLSLYFRHKTYDAVDTATSLYLMIVNGLVDLAMGGVTLLLLSGCYALRPVAFVPEGFFYWLALFFLQDFFYYVLHYADHHCRLFWAMHVTHHSSEHFNFSTGLRASVLEPLYRMFFFAPIAWMGFQPADILVMYALSQIVGVFVHNDRCGKLGPLEWIFVTPSHHRVHHGSNPKYLDKNIGMTLIVWDRVFGTFVEEDPAEPVRYGITKPVENRGPVNILMHEFRDIWHDVRHEARDWRERLAFVLGPPGWKPQRNTMRDPLKKADLLDISAGESLPGR